MKNLSKRKFVFCHQVQTDVPLEHGESCCDFFNAEKSKCEYNRYNTRQAKKPISYREELYKEFSKFEDQ